MEKENFCEAVHWTVSNHNVLKYSRTIMCWNTAQPQCNGSIKHILEWASQCSQFFRRAHFVKRRAFVGRALDGRKDGRKVFVILTSFCDLVHVQSVVDQFAKQLYNALNVSKITIDGQHHKNKGNLGFFYRTRAWGPKIRLTKSDQLHQITLPPIYKTW